MRPEDLEALPRARVKLGDGRGWTLCARCGFRQAEFLWSGDAVSETAIFGPGWAPRWEGDVLVARMSRRAWRRLSEGRAPAFRRSPYAFEGIYEVDERGQRRRHVIKADPRATRGPRVRLVDATEDDEGPHPYPFLADAVLAVCPACGLRQVSERHAIMAAIEKAGPMPGR